MVFLLSGWMVGWFGRGAVAPAVEVSHVPDLNVGSSKLTCYPRVVVPAHDAVCKVESERDGVQRHHLQSGLKPKGGNVRAYTPKVFQPRVAGESFQKKGASG